MNEDIRDIAPPLSLPDSWWWICAALGLLVLAAVGWRLARRFRRPSPVRVKPAHEAALEELERAQALILPDKAREFSIRVSEVVRAYIEERFQVRALRATTEEFMRGLSADPAGPVSSHSALLDEFLRFCDLAKFARWALSVPEMQLMLQSARRFVEATRPAERPPAGAGGRTC